MIPIKHTFRLVSKSKIKKLKILKKINKQALLKKAAFTRDKKIEIEIEKDSNKRAFFKFAGLIGVGALASTLIPKKAEALVFGSTPSASTVGVKNSSNALVNPATEETLISLVSGQGVSKLSINLSSSGIIKTPNTGKKIRVYASRFSLTADASSVSFRFTSDGIDHEKYVSPKTGGLYGANNHPNYIEGGVEETLYCVILGTTTIQINIDYLEI